MLKLISQAIHPQKGMSKLGPPDFEPSRPCPLTKHTVKKSEALPCSGLHTEGKGLSLTFWWGQVNIVLLAEVGREDGM